MISIICYTAAAIHKFRIQSFRTNQLNIDADSLRLAPIIQQYGEMVNQGMESVAGDDSVSSSVAQSMGFRTNWAV